MQLSLLSLSSALLLFVARSASAFVVLPRARLSDFPTLLFVGEGDNDPDPELDKELDGSMGGSRLKEVMNAAKSIKEKQRRLGAPPLNPFAPQAQTPAITTTPAAAPAAGNIDSLSTEEQAAMFRQMMAQTQGGQAGAGEGYPVPATMPKTGVDEQGRKIGRNRDADAIASTSDLYFAQLKRDSSVRTMARYNGDDDVANAVMADAGVEALNDQLKTNPYLQRENRMDVDLLDMEMFEQAKEKLIEEDMKEKSADHTSSGISYKDKLLSRRKNKGSANSASTTPKTTAATTPPPAAAIPVPVPVLQPPVKPKPTPVAAAAIPAPAPQSIPVVESVASEVTEERVVQPVAQPQTVLAGPQQAAAVPSGAIAQVTPINSNVKAALDCVEGAIQMYRNGSPELQKAMLPTLQAAMISAVNICNQVAKKQES